MFSLLLLASSAVAVPVRRDYTNELLGLAKDKLTFTDGHFKVASFSDMHFGERWGNGTWADWGPANDASTQRVHATVMDNEHPAYVVLNGDIVTGENLFADNATAYLDLAFAPNVERGVHFSTTHGNHDNANNINHQQIIEYETSKYGTLSYTRTDIGPQPWGVGNYCKFSPAWVPVYAVPEDNSPAVIMWFFDSRSFVSGTGNGPAQLMHDTWGAVPPALVFTHIPFQLSQELQDLPSPGDHDDAPPAVQGFDNDGYNGLDKRTFDALVTAVGASNILAITSGHDHGNNWCARATASSGVTLCFDGHSGYGGYTTTNSKVRNGRIFDLTLDGLRAEGGPRVDTWNAYEDGTTGEQVTLSKDYMSEDNQ
ncbi:Metallo-dependent phosphatase-like protein [Auriculariales sp. MPI-PUGE-AT-0066]|nr:Metallo-dependent phosphatase-like protein [Auriculariales sp. MPI-PUGE-AT-0066]